jgi:hypothetical protein
MSGRIIDEPAVMLVELTELGGHWRKLWSELDTEPSFDDAYMADGWDAFLHNGAIYWRQERGGEWTFELNVYEWLLENPPDEECDAIAQLYLYSKGIDTGSPFVLFQYIVGIAVTTQGMGLTSLMGISEQDGAYLGPAITGYSKNAAVVHAYIELLMSYDDNDMPRVLG